MEEHDLAREHGTRSQSDMDRMYQDVIAPMRWVVTRRPQAWRPPTDVYETDDAIVVRVELAGVNEADLGIELQGRLLVICGARQDPSPKVAYHQMEIRYGEFRVEVYLHWSINPEGIKAVYTDGFLLVTLPRMQPRKLHVVEADT